MQLLSWNYVMETTYVSNLAGEIALLCGLILWSTTYPGIRRKMFELFYYTHYLYIPFIIFFILHCGIFFPCIMLPGFYLFIIDRFLRFLQSRQKVQLVSARVLPCETVELNFAKNQGLSYSPTSTMFINVNSISKVQWHPFTVTSNCNLEPETISVIIKTEGTWTKNLYEKLSLPSSSSIDRLEVSVEGPYGPAQTDFLSHDTLIMICGGSGITPFISIIRELIYVSSKLRYKTPKIQLISVFKNSSNLTMLDLVLPISGVPSEACNLDLQIEAYITREQGKSMEKQEPARTISFKPKSSDAPVSSILGEYSWLWLSLIISSSFVIFLLLIGIVTQYYIYPIDHNAYRKEMTTKRAMINMLFICFSIAISATAAFLMNKRKIANEAKQIQGTKVSETLAETELESLPHQSLIKSTKVHYGGRPDLKRILLESKGSSVGVLVSGPKNMRHDVARICSSGLADNLHFQSISFSW
ncbi:oxidase [Lithospermum erythrorhizon]|uniref:ferric-chelate reductase (NADH) n=1 Tax=Lithospermum erythrorhizon TaxID=34254 RepID=A0AAV3QA52_LITER